jgi:hypothetical protein
LRYAYALNEDRRMNWRVIKLSSTIALVGSVIGWTIVWILQGGELEIVHVTGKLEGIWGLLLLVASTTVISFLTATLLAGTLPRVMTVGIWRRLIVWIISGAVVAELLIVPLGLICLLVGYLLQGSSSPFNAIVVSSMAWFVFAAPFGAASAALLWKSEFAEQEQRM